MEAPKTTCRSLIRERINSYIICYSYVVPYRNSVCIVMLYPYGYMKYPYDYMNK
jgi:hypothetical protein